MRTFSLFQPGLSSRRRHIMVAVVIWAGIALLLNLPWEIAQLPLYEFAPSTSSARLAYYVLHCVAGDVLIAAALFLLCGLVLSSRDWPITRPRTGAAIVMFSGVKYTAFSEWRNVYEHECMELRALDASRFRHRRCPAIAMDFRTCHDSSCIPQDCGAE